MGSFNISVAGVVISILTVAVDTALGPNERDQQILYSAVTNIWMYTLREYV